MYWQDWVGVVGFFGASRFQARAGHTNYAILRGSTREFKPTYPARLLKSRFRQRWEAHFRLELHEWCPPARSNRGSEEAVNTRNYIITISSYLLEFGRSGRKVSFVGRIRALRVLGGEYRALKIWCVSVTSADGLGSLSSYR